ncbi:unnamed protein product [Discula destructiva]
MTLYSAPPEQMQWSHIKPTILVCWWATLFSSIIILARVTGRFIRSETLFTEDKMALLCLVPLYIRMALVHVILLFGTNNIDLSGTTLTPEELRRREIGSGLVLASRIFYSATLWMLKNTILEFFKRLSGLTWSKAYQNSVLAMRCILVATFLAIVISDLAECRPFTHYWQVLPDPGGQCRQGYANLFTNGVCNVLTDVLLVALPAPLIITSSMTLKRKVQLVLLFAMSLLVCIVTLYRLPNVIAAHGSQQQRSLLASIELLVATAVANALVLGSFVRDRGVKKRRFKYGSITADSHGGTESDHRPGSRRPTVAERAWGSDDDLFRDVGFTIPNDRRSSWGDIEARPAQAMPAGPVAPIKTFDMQNWNFEEATTRRGSLATSDAPNSTGPKKVAFFDVGGLLDDKEVSGSQGTMRRQSTRSSKGLALPPSAANASANGLRRGSQALLQDLSGMWGHRVSSKNNAIGTNANTGAGEEFAETELRDLSPAVSPGTEVPPPLPPPDRRGSEPPPYESGRRTSDHVGSVSRD